MIQYEHVFRAFVPGRPDAGLSVDALPGRRIVVRAAAGDGIPSQEVELCASAAIALAGAVLVALTPGRHRAVPTSCRKGTPTARQHERSKP